MVLHWVTWLETPWEDLGTDMEGGALTILGPLGEVSTVVLTEN